MVDEGSETPHGSGGLFKKIESANQDLAKRLSDQGSKVGSKHETKPITKAAVTSRVAPGQTPAEGVATTSFAADGSWKPAWMQTNEAAMKTAGASADIQRQKLGVTTGGLDTSAESNIARALFGPLSGGQTTDAQRELEAVQKTTGVRRPRPQSDNTTKLSSPETIWKLGTTGGRTDGRSK